MTEINQQKKSYTPGGYKEFFIIAAPLVISNAALSLHHFVDRLFLSWAGQNELAASLPAGILAYTFLTFFMGISAYTNTLIAQYFGAKQFHNISRATWQGILFSFFAGGVSLLLLPLGLYLIRISGHDAAVMELEMIYFKIVYCGGIFYILNSALSSFYSGRGKTLVIMAVTIFSNVLNGVLDYALIFGVWGFPRWGIQGAAVATVIATAAMTLIYFILYLLPHNHKQYQTRSTYALDWDMMKRLIRFGVPSGVQWCLGIASFTVFVFLIGKIGMVELAASNIVIAINSLSFMPVVGAGIAASTLVGQYIGRKDYDSAEKSAYTAFYAVEIYMLFLAVIFFVFPEQLMRLFQGNYPAAAVPFEDIIQYGATVLLFVAVYQIFDAMFITFAGALRGAGDTVFAMWAEIVCAWCFFVPGIYVILFLLQVGVIYAWLWSSLYITLIAFVFIARFRNGRWKTIHVIDAG